MYTVIKSMNHQQRYWYACVLAKAAQADEIVHLQELNSFYHAFFFLDEASRKEILTMLKAKKVSDAKIKKIPEGLTKRQLANIYADVVCLICSDGDVSDDEEHILKELSILFGFSDDFYADMIDWSKSLRNVEKDFQNIINHHKERF